MEHCQQSAEIMKQNLHRRLRGKPLFGLRPLSVSLFLSLVVVFHSVSSLDKISFDEEGVLGQKRHPVYIEGGKQELGIPKERNDKPFDELRVSLIERQLKKKSAENPHKLDSQNPVATHWSSECPKLKELTTPSGSISFPMAGEYGNNLNCSWRIVAPPSKVIQLQVLRIGIEISDDCHKCCSFDRLLLYDGRRVSASSLMAKLCGYQAPPAPFTTTSSRALVVFESDENKGDDGFKLSYRFIPKHNGPSESKCGIPDFQPKEDSRIVGGKEATPHSWPWQVSIKRRIRGIWDHHCGGSVLHPQWIITAAHCFKDPKLPDSDYKIVLGEHNRTKDEGTEQEFEIKKLFLHENHDDITNENDIALIRLSGYVQFNSFIKPICLPDDYYDDVEDGMRCVATGWGLTLSTRNLYVLNQVYVPVINNSQCNKPGWYDGRITDNMICAGYPEGNKDACGGDSGGPLASLSDGGKWKLFGITSSGDGCAAYQHPGIYTRVKNYLKWIQKKTEQYE